MERSKELIQKNTPTRSSASYQSTLPRKALLWGEVEPAAQPGVHSGSTLLRALPHAAAKAALGPADLGLRREGSAGMGVRRSHQSMEWGGRAKQGGEVVTEQGWEIFYAKPRLFLL